jgi:tRNA A37 threonylcarbamoyladenosine synthetase subunit TsaC/SUA5/YrdC
LPGPLTLLLPPKREVLPPHLQYLEYVSFRISSDKAAQKLIAKYMEEYNAPLTCTSANLAGMPTMSSVEAILAQFGSKKDMVGIVIDGGDRTGIPSTIISVKGDVISCVREGAISFGEIMQ